MLDDKVKFNPAPAPLTLWEQCVIGQVAAYMQNHEYLAPEILDRIYGVADNVVFNSGKRK